MNDAERDLLWLLRAWLAHGVNGWAKRSDWPESTRALCNFVGVAEYLFAGITYRRCRAAQETLRRLLVRDHGTFCAPFDVFDGHANPRRVAWVRKTIKELESKQ